MLNILLDYLRKPSFVKALLNAISVKAIEEIKITVCIDTRIIVKISKASSDAR